VKTIQIKVGRPQSSKKHLVVCGLTLSVSHTDTTAPNGSQVLTDKDWKASSPPLALCQRTREDTRAAQQHEPHR
jgi:hypothetical protein